MMLKLAMPVARKSQVIPVGGTLQAAASNARWAGAGGAAGFISECLALDGVKWPGVLRQTSKPHDVEVDIILVHTKMGRASMVLLHRRRLILTLALL